MPTNPTAGRQKSPFDTSTPVYPDRGENDDGPSKGGRPNDDGDAPPAWWRDRHTNDDDDEDED